MVVLETDFSKCPLKKRPFVLKDGEDCSTSLTPSKSVAVNDNFETSLPVNNENVNFNRPYIKEMLQKQTNVKILNVSNPSIFSNQIKDVNAPFRNIKEETSNPFCSKSNKLTSESLKPFPHRPWLSTRIENEQNSKVPVLTPWSPLMFPWPSKPTSSVKPFMSVVSCGSDGIDFPAPIPQSLYENRHYCNKCTRSYSTFSGLTKHHQLHLQALSVKRSFGCKQCEKIYTTMGALKMHIRTHTLPCKCHLCGKAFSRPWLLQGHIRTHTGEKPFQCQQCERSFADRSNLRAHLQTHAEVKKYSCARCHKTFSRMSLLNKHQEGACLQYPI